MCCSFYPLPLFVHPSFFSCMLLLIYPFLSPSLSSLYSTPISPLYIFIFFFFLVSTLMPAFLSLLHFNAHLLSLNNLDLILHLISPFIPPLVTLGHLLRDRLSSVCSGGPAICRFDANSRPLLLHVPVLWQLWWRDAPTPEEERRLPAWPVGNTAVLHLTCHHVSMTCACTWHTSKIHGNQRASRYIFSGANILAVCAHLYTYTPMLVISVHSPSPLLFAIYSKDLLILCGSIL